jgi:hypothetical protein
MWVRPTDSQYHSGFIEAGLPYQALGTETAPNRTALEHYGTATRRSISTRRPKRFFRHHQMPAGGSCSPPNIGESMAPFDASDRQRRKRQHPGHASIISCSMLDIKIPAFLDSGFSPAGCPGMTGRPIAYGGIEPRVDAVVASHKLSAGRPCERRDQSPWPRSEKSLCSSAELRVPAVSQQ